MLTVPFVGSFKPCNLNTIGKGMVSFVQLSLITVESVELELERFIFIVNGLNLHYRKVIGTGVKILS